MYIVNDLHKKELDSLEVKYREFIEKLEMSEADARLETK